MYACLFQTLFILSDTQFSFLDHRHFETISLVLTSPYKDTHQWWAPYELARRYIFLTAVIFSPGNLVGLHTLVWEIW